MQAGMIGADRLQDLLPDRRVQQRFSGATNRGASGRFDGQPRLARQQASGSLSFDLLRSSKTIPTSDRKTAVPPISHQISQLAHHNCAKQETHQPRNAGHSQISVLQVLARHITTTRRSVFTITKFMPTTLFEPSIHRSMHHRRNYSFWFGRLAGKTDFFHHHLQITPHSHWRFASVYARNTYDG